METSVERDKSVGPVCDTVSDTAVRSQCFARRAANSNNEYGPGRRR